MKIHARCGSDLPILQAVSTHFLDLMWWLKKMMEWEIDLTINKCEKLKMGLFIKCISANFAVSEPATLILKRLLWNRRWDKSKALKKINGKNMKTTDEKVLRSC